MNKLILLIIFVVLVTTGLVGYKAVSEKNDKSAKNTSETIQKTPDQLKDETKAERSYGIHGILLAYSINNKNYPPSTKVGWNNLLDKSKESESLVDPFTETEYKFTSDDPEYGEIQYRFPASCDDDRKDFVFPNSAQSYAFRLKYSESIRCSHSL